MAGLFIPARCTLKSASLRREIARSAAWRWSRNRSRKRWQLRERSNTPARCILRRCAASRAVARSAAWRWISAALALPVFLLAMVTDLLPQAMPSFISMTALQWLEFALATPVVLWGGWPIFQRGWASLVNRHLNMFTLIALGVGVAWSYSVVAMLLPGIFPPAMRSMMDTVPVYFEAAAVIMALVLLGQVMELRARSQTSAAIKLLLGLAPKTARIVRSPLPPPPPPRARGQTNRYANFFLTAAKRTSRWNKCSRMMCCACAPARRCRWTV